MLIASLSPRPAPGEELRVLVISSGAMDPVTHHLTSELISMGATVEVTAPLAGGLAELARARRARAAIRILSSQRGVKLWVQPEESKGPEESAAEQLIEEPTGDIEDVPAALALRTAELFRARIVRIDRLAKTPAPEARSAAPAPDAPKPAPSGVAPAPSQAPPGDPRKPPPSPVRTDRALTLYLTPALVAHPGGGLSVGGAALGVVRLMLSPRLGCDLLALAPVVPAVITSPEGRVRISTTSIGIGGWLDLLERSLPVAAGVGAGFGIGFMGYDAEATTHNVVGHDGTVAFALPYFRLALEWRALPPLGVRADFLAGSAAPRPVIQVHGTASDAIFGRPLLAFGLGIQASIP